MLDPAAKVRHVQKSGFRGGVKGRRRTITSGAMIQFTITLNRICTQISLFLNTLCSVSNLTLQRIGYIITNNPTAIQISLSFHQFPSQQDSNIHNIPIGTETPTNLPFCKEGPVFGAKFPNMMPTAMARKIHIARKRSSHPKLLKMEVFDILTICSSPSRSACFSRSNFGGELGESG